MRGKGDEADRYSAAHNGLVAGSSPAGPTKIIKESPSETKSADSFANKFEPMTFRL
ncbi:hypothetical protein ACVIHH_004000 [Bradyrhizobium sp. USDA 4518]